jgi:uncharacterized phiE125 gp8 family phage protein
MVITADYVTQTVAPVVEPVTRTEAKLYSKIEVTEDDTLVDLLIQAAREEVEAYTGRAFVERTYRADVAYFDETMELPYEPIIAISHIKYYTAASPSVLTTLATTNYTLTRNQVIRSNGGTWPAVDSVPNAVQITYTAGYAANTSPIDEAATVPAAVKAAMYLIIGDLYENREGQVLYPGQMQTNPTVMRLLNYLRVYR